MFTKHLRHSVSVLDTVGVRLSGKPKLSVLGFVGVKTTEKDTDTNIAFGVLDGSACLLVK